MKAVIVNCFDTYEDRVNLVHEFLIDKGYETKIIQSDFRHIKKVHSADAKEDFIYVKSKPYYKNLSISRLSSHYKYSADAFKVVEKIKPDLLYVLIPPNSLAKFASSYKKKHKNVKLVFDLIDLWPETMPIGKMKRFLPFSFWGKIRNEGLKYADFVLTECDLYQAVLGNVLKGLKTETVYLAKKDAKVISNFQIQKVGIHLCYLGSINNIIDIPKIQGIIKAINNFKPVTLHIIGDGESKQKLIDEVKSVGAVVEYHGKIYDPQVKQEIFDKCHFGLNIMKESVCVGLTMKSIDYFQSSLPIINNIQADTSMIVDKHNVGFNIANRNLNDIANKIVNMDPESLLEMRWNTEKVFKELFSIEAANKKLEAIFRK